MELEKQYAPFPGARAEPTKLGSRGVDDSPRRPNEHGLASQNASAQKARPAGGSPTQHMSSRPLTPPASVPISVVLQPSPIKAHEYSEYDVKLTEATTEDEPRPKKRGRPKGWRKVGGPYTQAGVGSVSSPAGRVARSGRQKQAGHYSLKRRRKNITRADSPPPREVYLALRPTFAHFLCEWSGCKADLHNMDTLRRHVKTVHIKPQTQHRCAWGKCGKKSAGKPIDATTLITHLEQAHWVPMTWHVGDGTKNSWNWSVTPETTGDGIPDFLKDSDGNQVTPSTRDQEIEDAVTYKNNRRKLKELIMRRDENLESQSSDDSEGDVAMTPCA
ncbi:hypothetical protein NLG97_g4847 [Lecanicillium saksenae]|uniref:Uncharacterized protein n=1 Tax=Lecanicillium saksenae TaxID=468837 RepID=A0ACC1QY12_9HYPO|nr:hypothetical protein NLG97_g4847 [Lecanicillium saksenae]